MALARYLVEVTAGGQKMTTQDLTVMKAMMQKMTWLEKNQKVVAQNIANADTPGYRPQAMNKIDFRNMLEATASRLNTGNNYGTPPAAVAAPGLAATQTGHMNLDGSLANKRNTRENQQKDPYEVAPAGNAVVLEEQLLKMSENYTDHRFISNLYQKNIDMMRMSIKGQ